MSQFVSDGVSTPLTNWLQQGATNKHIDVWIEEIFKKRSYNNMIIIK